MSAVGAIGILFQALAATGASPQLESTDAALSAWTATWGSEWRAERDAGDGRVRMLYGGHRTLASEPVDEQGAAMLARQVVRDTVALHGVDETTLAPERAMFLPLSLIGTTDKWTVRFEQRVRDVEVVGGTVNVLIDTQGRLLSVQSNALTIPTSFSTEPVWDAAGATRVAGDDFNRRRRSAMPYRAESARLVVFPADVGGGRVPRLAWQLNVWDSVDRDAPDGRRYWIDAVTGSVLRVAPCVHSFDVYGSVATSATPGTAPDSTSNPALPTDAKYLRVEATDGTNTYVDYTNSAGFFFFAGANVPLTCTVKYVGEFNDVQNLAGSNFQTSAVVSPSTPVSILMNGAPTEYTTAESNVFVCTNAVRDFVRTTNPNDSTADVQFLSRVNQPATCNAFYTGTFVTYYNAGSSCPNTGYSTVVGHELGHWLNDLYGTGNGSDGMGEGNADTWAMYVFDTPVVGEDFLGSGQDLRTGWNTKPFCGDLSPGCYGEVHSDGEVWMGAAWKIRNNLNGTWGNAFGDVIANSLFLGWMNAYDQQTISSIIECQWLVLDDDNGNISDGSTHHSDIDAGFVAQGFPGVPVVPLVHYTFDYSAALGKDVTGHGFDANVVAALPVAGLKGKALSFLPNNNIAEFETPHAQALDLLGPMSGMAWIKPAGPHSTDNNPGCTEGTIFAKGGNMWFQIEKNNDQIVFQDEGSGDLVRLPVVPVVGLLPLNQWSHVAFVRQEDGKTVSIFLNGVKLGTQTLVNSPVSTTSPLVLGNYGFNGPSDCEFNGTIEEVRIYDTALCDECIEDIATHPPTNFKWAKMAYYW